MQKKKSKARKQNAAPVNDLVARPKRAARVKGGGINRIVVTDGTIPARVTLGKGGSGQT